MSGEPELPLPPPPSVGAIIKPRGEVRKPQPEYTFTINDDGRIRLGRRFKRSRKTGKLVEDLDGEMVDEWESYKTSHFLTIDQGPTPTKVEDFPARDKVMKTIRRKHRPILDEDGKETSPGYEEDVPYTRRIPARKVFTFANYKIIYAKQAGKLVERIRVNSKRQRILFSLTFTRCRPKRIPGQDAWRIETLQGEDMGIILDPPEAVDSDGNPVGIHFTYNKDTGAFAYVIEDYNNIKFPIVIGGEVAE